LADTNRRRGVPIELHEVGRDGRVTHRVLIVRRGELDSSIAAVDLLVIDRFDLFAYMRGLQVGEMLAGMRAGRRADREFGQRVAHRLRKRALQETPSVGGETGQLRLRADTESTTNRQRHGERMIHTATASLRRHTGRRFSSSSSTCGNDARASAARCGLRANQPRPRTGPALVGITPRQHHQNGSRRIAASCDQRHRAGCGRGAERPDRVVPSVKYDGHRRVVRHLSVAHYGADRRIRQ
jgi:hypothetical protein